MQRLWLARGRDDARVAKLVALAAAAECPVERVDPQQLARQAGAGHQGVVAEVQPQPPWNEDVCSLRWR